MNTYNSFVINGQDIVIDYDTQELSARGFKLKVRCNKTNPDFEKYVTDKENGGDLVEVISIDPIRFGNDMVDVWVKENGTISSFAKVIG